ncbi:MAG: response regulator [Deltaproteobacteria bacterium]|nr:response regulator [Deltaproteobacteria bacterium]
MNAMKKVLVLDDEPIVCERLKPALEKIGFYVETFNESQEVIDRVTEENFDVLVTDLKMKKPDGIEVMKYVNEKSPGTKVIIITGFATEETAREALSSGAVDFIAKPFKISQLRDLIVKITGDE